MRHDIFLASAILHGCAKLLEYGPDTKKTEIEKAFIRAQLGAVRCYEAGLPYDIAHLVGLHPFTPPHTHVTPPNIEFVMLTYCDLAAADPMSFLQGRPTHLEIKKRFFSVD